MGTAIKSIGLLVIVAAVAASIYLFAHQQTDSLAILQDAKKSTVAIYIEVEGGSGIGSGAIISEDGYIVTNNHVVEDSINLYVVLADHQIYKAEVIGRLKEVDLALIKIDAQDLPYFEVNEEEVIPGQDVYAIGAPLFMEQSVTKGIISNPKRSKGALAGEFTYYVQSNLACNPGNSGGPLVSADGSLIGINSWGKVSYVSNEGEVISNPSYCFSVPARVIAYVVDHIKENKKVRERTIDAQYKEVDVFKSYEMGFEKLVGVRVTNLDEDGVSAKAGLQPNDIIIEFNDEEINSETEMLAEITFAPMDEPSEMVLWRNGEIVELKVTPEFNYTDKEWVYKVIRGAHESCGLDYVCIKNTIDVESQKEKNKYKQQLLSNAASQFAKEVPKYEANEKQCDNDDYHAAKKAMNTCFIDTYQRIMDGEQAREGDEQFNACISSALSKLDDNPYAQAGMKLVENKPQDNSEQEGESGDSQVQVQACMSYWLSN